MCMRGVMGAPKKKSILLLVFECADRCREGRCLDDSGQPRVDVSMIAAMRRRHVEGSSMDGALGATPAATTGR